VKLNSAEGLFAIPLAANAENLHDLHPGFIDENSDATNMLRDLRQDLPSPLRRKIAMAGRIKVKTQGIGTALYRL
jgi:hypothetical protein